MPPDEPPTPPKPDATPEPDEVFELMPDGDATPKRAEPPPTPAELARLRARERAELEPLASDDELDAIDDALDAEAKAKAARVVSEDPDAIPLVVKEPLVRARIASAGTIAIAGGVLTLLAFILAWVTAEKDGFLRGLAALVNTLTFSLLGICAAWIVSQVEQRPLGSYAACAARMLACVAAFQCAVHLKLGLPARLGEIALALGLYLLAIMVLFGLSPRRALRIAGFHFVLSLLVGLTIWANSMLVAR